MVKVIAFIKRRTGMGVEEFQTYWRTRHPEVVTKLPGVRRYIQSHVLPATYKNGEPVYDGIAELWFDDTAAMRALQNTPEIAAVEADEARFIDRSRMGVVVTEDHPIKDGAIQPGMTKGVVFLRRKPGMAVEAFQRYWREVHGPIVAAIPTLRRYAQSHTRLAGYNRKPEPTWDGIAGIWFDDPAGFDAATRTPVWRQAAADTPNFADPASVTFILTTEHVIVD